MAYTKTVWVNNQAPAINAENLNKIEDGIYNSVRYADAQTLTDAQKTQARGNIGAAPAGYGLGESGGQALSNVSLNSLINNGWYFLYLNNTDGPDNVNISYSILFVSSDRSDLTKVQRLILGVEGMQGYELRRVYNNVSWLPWEWVNPPMKLGVEYRTTERYLWKPVYVKVIDVGALPNADQKTVSHGIDNIDKFVSVYGRRYSTATSETNIPYENYNSKCGVYANISSVFVYCSTNESTSTGYVTLKYTKTTD